MTCGLRRFKILDVPIISFLLIFFSHMPINIMSVLFFSNWYAFIMQHFFRFIEQFEGNYLNSKKMLKWNIQTFVRHSLGVAVNNIDS